MEMRMCDFGHQQIVFNSDFRCPMCALTEHNNKVHDFIEQDPELVKKLVEYLDKED